MIFINHISIQNYILLNKILSFTLNIPTTIYCAHQLDRLATCGDFMVNLSADVDRVSD